MQRRKFSGEFKIEAVLAPLAFAGFALAACSSPARRRPRPRRLQALSR
jgi:hypothetical protein